MTETEKLRSELVEFNERSGTSWSQASLAIIWVNHSDTREMVVGHCNGTIREDVSVPGNRNEINDQRAEMKSSAACSKLPGGAAGTIDHISFGIFVPPHKVIVYENHTRSITAITGSPVGRAVARPFSLPIHFPSVSASLSDYKKKSVWTFRFLSAKGHHACSLATRQIYRSNTRAPQSGGWYHQRRAEKNRLEPQTKHR